MDENVSKEAATPLFDDASDRKRDYGTDSDEKLYTQSSSVNSLPASGLQDEYRLPFLEQEDNEDDHPLNEYVYMGLCCRLNDRLLVSNNSASINGSRPRNDRDSLSRSANFWTLIEQCGRDISRPN